MGLTDEQFSDWIERARSGALKYAAKILRGSRGPTLKIKPGRSQPRALEHGVEEEVLQNVVLRLLEGDPPLYATEFQGTYPEDYDAFTAWLFTRLKNETLNEGRRVRQKREQEVSTDEGPRVQLKVDRKLAGQYVDLKREDHAERLRLRTLDAETALIEQTKQEAAAESGLFEEDRTAPRVRPTEPVAYPDDLDDDVEAREALLDDPVALMALITDFPRSHVGFEVPEPKRVGAPRKWSQEEARRFFSELTILQHAILKYHGEQLARGPDETDAAHQDRIATMLLELDREYVKTWGPFGFSVNSPRPDDVNKDAVSNAPWDFTLITFGVKRPGAVSNVRDDGSLVPEGFTFVGYSYDPVYRDLTEDAAAEIAASTPARANSLALALYVFYHEDLSEPTVRRLVTEGRDLTPGTVRRRRTRT